MAYEFRNLGLRFQRQRPVSVAYKDLFIPGGYRIDFVIEEQVVLEIKAIEQLLPVHEAQLLTYLKLTNLRTGLLVNFGAATLRQGLRRLTHK